MSRREAIMVAAVTVLAERGPRGLTHRAVDAAAGLSAGSVNYHAPTRAKLLLLALEEVFRRDVDTAAAHFAIDEWSAEIAIDAISAFVIEMSSESNRERVIARHHLRAESLTNPDIRAQFDRQTDTFVGLISQLFEQAGNPINDTRAELIRMSIDGMMQRQVMIGAKPLTDDQVNEMFGLVIRGTILRWCSALDTPDSSVLESGQFVVGEFQRRRGK